MFKKLFTFLGAWDRSHPATSSTTPTSPLPHNRDSVPFLFIDGLPVDITRDQVKALLAPYGVAVTIAIALRPHSDFLAFAFVVMRTEAEADAARVALNGAHMIPHAHLRLASSISPPFGWLKRSGTGIEETADLLDDMHSMPISVCLHAEKKGR